VIRDSAACISQNTLNITSTIRYAEIQPQFRLSHHRIAASFPPRPGRKI
jgi:hypothetical protein